MQMPDLFAVRVALETALFATVREEFTAGTVVIVQPADELKPDLRKIQILHSVNPGEVQSGELGRIGVCPRVGVYTITLSCPPHDTAMLEKAWRLCSLIESSFYRVDLPIPNSSCRVMCEEPYTTNVGEVPDKRLAMSVTVPWWTWTGGHEGE